MEKIQGRETRRFKGLTFKESKKKKLAQRTFVGKIKTYTTDPKGNKLRGEDGIVIADGSTPIDREGKWDVEVVRMRKGVGWIVTSATYTNDILEIHRNGPWVYLLINGTEQPLKKGGRNISLAFDASNYFDPKKIAENIREKVGHLQVYWKDNSLELFLGVFVQLCATAHLEYEEAYKPKVNAMVAKFNEKWGKARKR